MSQLVTLVVIVGVVLTTGLLTAIATLLRRPRMRQPTYLQKSKRHRLDMWTDQGR